MVAPTSGVQCVSRQNSLKPAQPPTRSPPKSHTRTIMSLSGNLSWYVLWKYSMGHFRRELVCGVAACNYSELEGRCLDTVAFTGLRDPVIRLSNVDLPVPLFPGLRCASPCWLRVRVRVTLELRWTRARCRRRGFLYRYSSLFQE